MDRIDVIYIAGSGHSGSTLLDLLLGSHSRIESVGEIYKYVDPERRKRISICTCGEPIGLCPYWSRVRAGLSEEEVEATDPAIRLYGILRTVLEASGKQYVCDSSKIQAPLETYASRPDLFNLKIVHLVRDARGHSYSMLKKRARKLAEHGNVFRMKSELVDAGKRPSAYEYHSSVLRWVIANYRIARRFENSGDYFVIRYEDLADDTEECLNRLMDQLGLGFEANQLRFSDFVHHNISGNRMRMAKSDVIKVDNEYVNRLSLPQWLIGTVLMLPLMFKYGYRLSRG